MIPTAPSHRCLDPFTKSCDGFLKICEAPAIRLPLLDASSAGSLVENRYRMLKHQTLLVRKLELFRVNLIGKRNYCVLEVGLSELL